MRRSSPQEAGALPQEAVHQNSAGEFPGDAGAGPAGDGRDSQHQATARHARMYASPLRLLLSLPPPPPMQSCTSSQERPPLRAVMSACPPQAHPRSTPPTPCPAARASANCQPPVLVTGRGTQLHRCQIRRRTGCVPACTPPLGVPPPPGRQCARDSAQRMHRALLQRAGRAPARTERARPGAYCPAPVLPSV